MLRAVVVGLGRIAWRGFGLQHIETHAGTLLHHPRIRIVGASDKYATVSASFMAEFCDNRGIVITPDLMQCVRVSEPDAVVVCTPPETHLEVIESVLRYRPKIRGILCEKPLASTVADAERIVDLCQGRALLVGHQRRYDLRHRALRGFLAGNGIGDLQAARAIFRGDHLNNGSHAADLCRYLVGDGVPWTIRRGNGFGITLTGSLGSASLWSDGVLAPGYMGTMYDDLANCIDEPGLSPTCSGQDGVEAVRQALIAQERDGHFDEEISEYAV